MYEFLFIPYTKKGLNEQLSSFHEEESDGHTLSVSLFSPRIPPNPDFHSWELFKSFIGTKLLFHWMKLEFHALKLFKKTDKTRRLVIRDFSKQHLQ